MNSDFLESWIERYEETAAVNRKGLGDLQKLLRVLDCEKIEALPLKGLDLLLRVYAGLGRRSLGDYDIFVREKDLARLCLILEREGYLLRPHASRFLTESFVNESIDYVSKDSGLNLDISWNFWYLDSAEALWERCVVRETPLGRRKFLHPEDALLYLVAYTVARRGQFGHFFGQDLKAFLEKETAEINWTRWCQEIERKGLRVPLYYGLTYARKKGVCNIPEKVLKTLNPRNFFERKLWSVYVRMVTEEKARRGSFLFPFLGTPTWRGKWRLLKRALFPSFSLVQLRHGKVRHSTYFFAGFLRPFRIFLKALYIIPGDILHLIFSKKRGDI